MAMETLIPACAEVGLVAMEGISPKYYPLMAQHKLAVSLCGSHGFDQGPLDPDNHAMCVDKLRKGIDLRCAMELQASDYVYRHAETRHIGRHRD